MSARPRIQILVDRPRHAQARTARAIARYLSDEFDCRVRYETEAPDLGDEPCDLLYVSSWDSTWYRQFDFEPSRIVKSVLDHRWSEAVGPGGLSPAEFAATWLDDAALVTCCSERLRGMLAPHCDVAVAPPGFDPFVFPPRTAWGGPLRFGWIGDRSDRTNGFENVLRPAARAEDVQLAVSDGDPELAVIGEFLRSIDVFVLASEQEGAPLSLVEAMASGCFPLCVDVGAVPELIEHGDNGLILPRSVEAFEEAFAWCRTHADHVRRAGMRGAEHMRHRHTWEHVADRWREVFHAALERRGVGVVRSDPERSGVEACAPVPRRAASLDPDRSVVT